MKTFHVIKREYMENVRKKSFLISTILVPVLLLAFTFVPMLATFFVPDTQVTLAVIDRTGEVAEGFVATLKDTLKDGRRKYVIRGVENNPRDYEAAKNRLVSAIKSNQLDVVVDIPPGVFSSGKVFYYTREVGNVQILESFENRLSMVILKKRLSRAGLDYAKVKDLTEKVSLEMHRVTKSGEVEKKNFLSDWGVVFVFMMMLYMTLLTWGMSIQRSLVEEKGSRVIEVLLSSLEPKDIFFGKIIGIGAVGLTQLAIWMLAGAGIGLYAYMAAAKYMEYISFPPAILAYFFLFFILGFFFYSSIFALVGAICSTEQEAQQLQGLLTLPLIVPILILMIIIQSPNSTFSIVLSMIPFFSPLLMLARIIVLMPSFWEIALSLAILLLSIYGMVYFSSRVFRVGILMYGKRPNLKEIIKWFKYA